MRDIDWWCLIETCWYVNERYRLMMSYVCMLMRDIVIDWCLIETCLYVNERYRLMLSYWTMFVC